MGAQFHAGIYREAIRAQRDVRLEIVLGCRDGVVCCAADEFVDLSVGVRFCLVENSKIVLRRENARVWLILKFVGSAIECSTHAKVPK